MSLLTLSKMIPWHDVYYVCQCPGQQKTWKKGNIRNNSVSGLSQLETTLQWNVISHWLSPYPEWSQNIMHISIQMSRHPKKQLLISCTVSSNKFILENKNWFIPAVSQLWNGTCGSNPSPWEIKSCLSCIVNRSSADCPDDARIQAISSHGIDLVFLNYLVSAPEARDNSILSHRG